MRDWVDLHCHWVAGIDDGVRTPADGLALLRGLHQAGFGTVVATPHMRPGMFDNDQASLRAAYRAMLPFLEGPGLPQVHLASEHFFDDIVFARILHGEALPYPSLQPNRSAAPGAEAQRKQTILIEFSPQGFPPKVEYRLVDLARAGFRPVIAHPERYQPVWRDDHCLDSLLDAGASLLLDVCALSVKYGNAAKGAAEHLLDGVAYEAACSDANRPDDVPATVAAIACLRTLVGEEEQERLLGQGPRGLLGLRASSPPLAPAGGTPSSV